MAGINRKWRTSFLGPRDALGAPAAAEIVATHHEIDPETELAAWFLGGMSLPEMELTLQEMETKGDDGSFIMCDLSFLAPRAVYAIRVLNTGLVEEFVVERAPTPPGGYRLKGMALDGSDEAWPTVFSLVECLSNEIRAPLPVKLDMQAAFLGGGMPTLVRRRTSRRRSKRRMSAVSLSGSNADEDEHEELFGFGDLLDDVAATAKLQTLDTAFNLRDVLRRQATVLERQDEQERMRDPFWEDVEVERRRNKEHNRRTLSAEQLGQLAEEDAAAARDRQLRVKKEQTALRKEAQQAKRATIVGRQHVPNHRRASGDVSAVDDLLASMHKVSALAEELEPADGEFGAAPGPSIEDGESSPTARAIIPAQEHDLAEVDGPDSLAVDAPLGAAGAASRQSRLPSQYDGFSESAADPESAEGAPQFTRKGSAVGVLNADFGSIGSVEAGEGGSDEAAVDESAEGSAPFGRKKSVYHGFASDPADPANPADPADVAVAAAAQEAPTAPPPMNRFAGRQKTTAKKEPEPEPESAPDPSSPGKRRFRFTF